MATPFTSAPKAVPVWVVRAGRAGALPPGTARLQLPPPQHEHGDETPCPACASLGDIRLALFELMLAARKGQAPPFDRVVVEARNEDEHARIVASLTPGRVPAMALRDHTVARSFRLAGAI